jgi:hypothetical protein
MTHTPSLAYWLKTGTCVVAIAAQVACTSYDHSSYRPPLVQSQSYPGQSYGYAPYAQPTSPIAAYGYPPPPPPVLAPQPDQPAPASDSGPSLGALLLGGLILGGLIAAAASSSSPTSSASDTQAGDGNTSDEGERLRLEDARRRLEAQQEENNRDTTPDTSVGCAWGDRAAGTCH